MGNITFAWDRRKARFNQIKHGVTFEEAQSVFLDESARLIDDPDHSGDEERLLLLGFSFQARDIAGRIGDSDEKRIRFLPIPQESIL